MGQPPNELESSTTTVDARERIAEIKAAALAQAERQAALTRAHAVWAAAGAEAVPHRTSLLIAAHLLECRPAAYGRPDEELIGWLRQASPQYFRQVATGVAVYALRRGYWFVWDVLMFDGMADRETATASALSGENYVWVPESTWLIP